MRLLTLSDCTIYLHTVALFCFACWLGSSMSRLVTDTWLWHLVMVMLGSRTPLCVWVAANQSAS